MSVEPEPGRPTGTKGRQLLLLAGGVVGVALVIVAVFMLAKKIGGGTKGGEAPASGVDPMQACIKGSNDARDEGKRDNDKSKLDEAVRKMEECVKAHADQAIIHWYMGEAYQDANRPCDGLKAYEKAAELWASDPSWGPQAKARANDLRAACGKK